MLSPSLSSLHSSDEISSKVRPGLTVSESAIDTGCG